MFIYRRDRAVNYANKWSYNRNPKYLDFENLGGDCTNYVSQCIYAGSLIMNYTPTFGWYYINSNNRAPAWTGVEYLYNFLTSNKGVGPFAEEVDITDIRPADIIQLSFDGITFSHTPIVVSTGLVPSFDNILIAAHSYDRNNYPITNYNYKKIRFVHIIAVR